ncbi:MAG: hopanoid biosynthesis associated protein HpnK [Limisphaerales bacterium]|jgi:hopanoid biosynthesis associated protein HpnK
MASEPARKLIVNADDFGRSKSINTAVLRAHREGFLTSASLMVNGEAFDEAVRIAKSQPTLAIGLHLTLVCGKATLPPPELPGLIDPFGNFSDSPVWTGFRYWARRKLRPLLEKEIASQFAKFNKTGLALDHVNGHLNMHLHPTVFDLLMQHHRDWNVRHLRLTRDPYELNRRLDKGEWLSRHSHAAIFDRLARRALPHLAARKIRHTDRVFGLLQNGRIDADFITRLLPLMPTGTTELYSHPSCEPPAEEFDALINQDIRAQIERHNIQLTTYGALDGVIDPSPASSEIEFKASRRQAPEEESNQNDETHSYPAGGSALRSARGRTPEQGLKADRRTRKRQPRGYSAGAQSGSDKS